MTLPLCFSPDIIITTESVRMRWAELDKHIGRREISAGDRRERDHLADLGVDFTFF
jgi:hypothetical protein